MAEWSVTEIELGGYGDVAVALDSAGVPRISFGDYDNGYPSIAKLVGVEWQVTVLDSTEVNWRTDITIDSQGRIWIVWDTHSGTGASYREHIKAAYWDGDSWSVQTIVSTSNQNDHVYYPSIAIDSDDVPHVVWLSDEATIDKVRYAKWNGASWDSEVVVTGYYCGSLDIEIDHNDAPCLAYCRWHPDNNWWQDVLFARKLNGSWFHEQFDGFTEAPHFGICLAFTSNNRPCIIYDQWYALEVETVKCAVYNGDSWDITVIEPDCGYYQDLNRYEAIAVDSQDTQHAAWADWADDAIRYAKKVGENWEVESIAADPWFYLDMKLDALGNAHIVWVDWNDILRYATAQVYVPVEPAIPPDPGYEVRLYDSEGRRKRLPNRAIESLDWELIERGYYGTCRITLADDFDAGVIQATGGDYVEVWLNGTLRYRGYIGTPEQLLEIPEKKTITAYGRAERLNSIRVDKRYVYPGGVDISQAFARIVSDYIAPKITNLETDIQAVGFTVENLAFERVTARQALDTLADMAARRAVWGFEVNPETGSERIFLRPKSTEEKYKFQIGGRVKSYSYPPDYSQIVNSLHVVGAEAKYPNLVANSSFEQPKQADASEGDLITDGGFETGLYWTYHNGASRKGPNNMARTGNYDIEIDHDNEYIEQTNRTLTGGEDHLIEAWYLSPHGGMFYFQIVPDVGSIPDSPVVWCTPIGELGSGGYYRKASYQFKAPDGATSCTVRIIASGDADDLRIDDVRMFQTSGIVQSGWGIMVSGGVTDLLEDWAFDEDKAHGAYALRVKATIPDENYVILIQSAANAISVEPNESYTLSAALKDRLGGGTNNVQLGLYITREDGSSRWEWGGKVSLPLDEWSRWYWSGWAAGSDDQQVRVVVRLIEGIAERDYDFLIDAVMFTSYNADDPDGSEFIPGKNYEFDLDTESDFVQADPELPAAVKDSISTYGEREAEESVDGLADLGQAQNWAVGYFGVHAQPVIAHRVEIANWEEEIKPDGLLKLLDSTIAPAFPVRIGYQLDGASNMVNLSIDLNTERPSFEGLLQRVLQQAKREARSGISGSASAAIPGGSGGGSGGIGHAQEHVLADTSGLGDDHTTSGLTAGQILRATGAEAAAFESDGAGSGLDADLLDGEEGSYYAALTLANIFTAAQTAPTFDADAFNVIPEALTGSETSLVSLWHFDEGTGTTVDDAKGGTDLTLISAGWDSVNQLIGASCATVFAYTASNPLSRVAGWTVMGWIYSSNYNASGKTILCVGNTDTGSPIGGGDPWALFQIHNRVPRIYSKGLGTYTTEGLVSLVDGCWHHIACTYDGSSTYKMYIDGVLATTAVGEADTTRTGMFIGDGFTGGALAGLRLDEWAYFNTEITDINDYVTNRISLSGPLVSVASPITTEGVGSFGYVRTGGLTSAKNIVATNYTKLISEGIAGDNAHYLALYAGSVLAIFQYSSAFNFGISAQANQTDSASDGYSMMCFGASRNTMFGDLAATQTDPGPRATIKGATADNTKSALSVIDSADATLFNVRNDGQITTQGTIGMTDTVANPTSITIKNGLVTACS